jgi:hypothetical protein
MKTSMLISVPAIGLGQSSCAFLGGAVVGAGGAGTYEYDAYRQMPRLENVYKAERITRAEYEKRRQQIDAGSITNSERRLTRKNGKTHWAGRRFEVIGL